MKNYFEKHHKVFGGIGAFIALAIALVYLVVTPEESSDVSGILRIILIYGHSVCWLLLCVASALWAIYDKNRWSVILAYAALAVYVVFIGSLFVATSV